MGYTSRESLEGCQVGTIEGSAKDTLFEIFVHFDILNINHCLYGFGFQNISIYLKNIWIFLTKNVHSE